MQGVKQRKFIFLNEFGTLLFLSKNTEIFQPLGLITVTKKTVEEKFFFR